MDWNNFLILFCSPFIYVRPTLFREQYEAYINSLRWSALVRLEPAYMYTLVWDARSTTVLQTITLCAIAPFSLSLSLSLSHTHTHTRARVHTHTPTLHPPHPTPNTHASHRHSLTHSLLPSMPYVQSNNMLICLSCGLRLINPDYVQVLTLCMLCEWQMQMQDWYK